MTQAISQKSESLFTPILIASSLILFLSFMIRASFGVFQIPIAEDLGWLRSDFSLAIAIQNLAWGLATPLFGAFAERLGDRRAILIGIGFYAAGLLFSAYSVSSSTSYSGACYLVLPEQDLAFCLAWSDGQRLIKSLSCN